MKVLLVWRFCGRIFGFKHKHQIELCILIMKEFQVCKSSFKMNLSVVYSSTVYGLHALSPIFFLSIQISVRRNQWWIVDYIISLSVSTSFLVLFMTQLISIAREEVVVTGGILCCLLVGDAIYPNTTKTNSNHMPCCKGFTSAPW